MNFSMIRFGMKFDIKSAMYQVLLLLPIVLLTVVSVTHAQAACTGTDCLQNPTGNGSLQSFLAAAFKGLVKVSLPVITVFIVYSGFLFVTAQGRPAQLDIAKRNLFFSLLGALLILSAWVLANIIGGTVTNLTTG
jgi:hypothetical protein